MIAHNKFTDPAVPAARAEYTWQINHDEEGENGRERSVDSSQNVAGTRTIQTQGELTPIKFTFQGKILEIGQLAEMNAWQNLCETRTILLTDFAGDVYEGLISSFKWKRVRTARNSRDLERPWYWTYTLEFTVVRALWGFLAGSPG
jgi:hypothetical protein